MDVIEYEFVENKLKVGSGAARGYFVSIGAWSKLKAARDDVTNPLSDLADAVLITASDASSWFGLDETKSEGVSNHDGAMALVAGGILTDEQRLAFLEKAKRRTRPFSDVPQFEYDAVLAEIDLIGEIESTSTSYNGAGVPHMVVLKNDELIFDIVFDFPVPVDALVKIFAESYDAMTDTYIREARPVSTITVGVSKTTGNARTKTNYGSRKVRFVAVSYVNLTSNLRITVA